MHNYDSLIRLSTLLDTIAAPPGWDWNHPAWVPVVSGAEYPYLMRRLHLRSNVSIAYTCTVSVLDLAKLPRIKRSRGDAGQEVLMLNMYNEFARTRQEHVVGLAVDYCVRGMNTREGMRELRTSCNFVDEGKGTNGGKLDPNSWFGKRGESDNLLPPGWYFSI